MKTYFNVLLTGFLLALFLRNIIVSVQYIWRGKVKNKLLFYLLLVSQALAPFSVVPIIVSFFVDVPHCAA